MPTQCEMIVGYLAPHRCDNLALGTCVKCRRSYCEEHVEVKPEGLICLACAQGLAQPGLRGEHGGNGSHGWLLSSFWTCANPDRPHRVVQCEFSVQSVIAADWTIWCTSSG